MDNVNIFGVDVSDDPFWQAATPAERRDLERICLDVDVALDHDPVYLAQLGRELDALRLMVERRMRKGRRKPRES